MPRLNWRTTLETTLPQHALVVRVLLHYLNDLRDQLDLDPITEAQVLETLRDLQPPPPATGD
jgi:hypothetical protein